MCCCFVGLLFFVVVFLSCCVLCVMVFVCGLVCSSMLKRNQVRLLFAFDCSGLCLCFVVACCVCMSFVCCVVFFCWLLVRVCLLSV